MFHPAALLLASALAATPAGSVLGVEPGQDGIPRISTDQAISCPSDTEDGRVLLSFPSSGQRRQRGSCHEGLAVQRWIAWYETGGRAWRAFLESGLLEGRFESWYSNGQTRSMLQYVEGLLHGDAWLWWEDGTQRAKGRYEQGLRQGCHRSWHLGGQPAAKGAYHDGERVGRWLYWDEQGNRSKEHHGGLPLTGRCWTPWF